MPKTIEQMESELEAMHQTLRDMMWAIRTIDNEVRLLQDIVMRMAVEERK